jgi:hypothetical protein
MKTKRSKAENQPGNPEFSGCSNHATVSAGEHNRREVRLEIPAGEPDLSALRSAMREWLVPRLVEDFLRERGIELKHSRVRAINPNSNTEK